MKIHRSFQTSHDCEAVLTLSKDPNFLLRKLFPPVSSIEKRGNKFKAEGSYMHLSMTAEGVVLVSSNAVTYMLKTGDSVGKIELECSDRKIELDFEYEGCDGFLAKRILSNWFDRFVEDFEENVRLMRIERRV
ncbi:DUF3211 domain-containing protein [Metallosphaera tengchongensis]|uniref:DUF3211 domain-containing protein n=1 Tax=Metallosphaera tengchongensis TaxID=1532350 RepID=A0A6N0NVX1_9CREN|nr:STK_08120 family protein [Metallosphaera tengchongensis]QKR00892.1 DUF3211 domain-containing protein [Metallosphaera tengchongensis]